VEIASPLEAYRFDLAVATAGVCAETRAMKEPAAKAAPAEPATFNPRKGLKGRIPFAQPTPAQEAELDRLFPPDWYKQTLMS
jgi:hypothetical protein